MKKVGIRTDLAVESRERFVRNQVEVSGVTVTEHYDVTCEVRTTIVEIVTDHAARVMEKPKGRYITLEAPSLADVEAEREHHAIAEKLSKHLREMVGAKRRKKILVAGLGNDEITPDALGPQTAKRLEINRHMIRKYGMDSRGEKEVHQISSIIPGVMARTGMETREILKGVITETKPDLLIAVDALAARSTRRLNTTIQLSDTGITPGAGVLNHRHGLDQASLGIPVIALGVPMVVDAAVIVHDAIEHLLETLEEADMEEFLEELITPKLQMMFVTPKDVDASVQTISSVLTEGLNRAFGEKE